MIVHLKRWLVLALAGVLSVAWSSCTTSQPGQGEKPAAEKSLAASTASDSNPQQQLSQADINAIIEAVNEGAANYREGQFLVFSDKFSADAKLMPPNSPPIGKADIGAFAKKSPKIDTLMVGDIDVSGAGNHATVTASLTMTGKTNNPANNNAVDFPVSSTGTLHIVMDKASGAWLAKNLTYTPQ